MCECICNHSGACTGCGICCLKAYNERMIRLTIPLPGGGVITGDLTRD